MIVRPIVSRALFLPISMALSFAQPLVAGQISYNLTTVVAPNGDDDTVPAINNSGTIAYIDVSKSTLYSNSNGTPTALIVDPGIAADSGYAAINDAGQATAMADQDVLRGGPGGETTISSSSPIGSGSFPSYGLAPAIEGNGTVAFTFGHIAGGQGNGFFAGSGGSLTSLYSNPNGSSTLLDPSASRDANVVAYAVPINGSYGNGTAIYVNGSQIGSSPLFFDAIAVNSSGTVAMYADGIGELFGGIYEASNGQVSEVVAGVPDTDFFDGVSINDSGVLAYKDNGTVFVRQGTTSQSLLSVGDSYDGLTISSVFLGQEALNNNGQVALSVSFSNGESAILLDTPTAVPEPSSILLLMIGAPTLAFAFRRRATRANRRAV